MPEYKFYFDDSFEREDNYRDVPLCEVCGTELKKITEEGEAWGSPFIHEYWECPRCDR